MCNKFIKITIVIFNLIINSIKFILHTDDKHKYQSRIGHAMFAMIIIIFTSTILLIDLLCFLLKSESILM